MDRQAILAAEKVAVKYIGRKEPWIDRLYGSKLPFNKGQVRVVPSNLALRLLRHQDLFTTVEANTPGDAPNQGENNGQNAPDDLLNLGQGTGGDTGSTENAGDNGDDTGNQGEKTEDNSEDKGDDNTDELLDKAKAEQEAKDEQERERQDVIDRVQGMDKDALDNFAYSKYEQRINKRKSVENLREDVIGMIDRFGVV